MSSRGLSGWVIWRSERLHATTAGTEAGRYQPGDRRLDGMLARRQRGGQGRRAGHETTSRGMTLIEVLFVVATLALLVAILLPALSSARQQTASVKCQSNLRQLAISWHQFLDAHKGRFPRGPTMQIDYGGKQGTKDLVENQPVSKPLNPTLKLPLVTTSGAEIFQCPSDRGTPDDKGGITSCFDYYGTSYKANPILIGPLFLPTTTLDPCYNLIKNAAEQLKSFTRDQIANPSRVLLKGDFGWEDAWNYASTTRSEWHKRPDSHNIAFMDGHSAFTLIRKGFYTTGDYTVLPFKSLQAESTKYQRAPK